MSDGRENAAWQSNNCGYGTSTAGNTVLAGTTLYHGGTPVVLGPDPELRSGLREWVYFSTCHARVAGFGGNVQTFVLTKDLPATYTKHLGGDEFAEEFFRERRRIAYFSNKECEVVIRTEHLDEYLREPYCVTGVLWHLVASISGPCFGGCGGT